MNALWQQFLQQQGARIEEGRITAFADEMASESATLLMPLSRYSLIRAKGEESADFLQGQLGNDVRQVDGEHHQLSSYSSPKGRILAAFRLFRRGDEYLLRLPVDNREATLKRLSMFVLRSKVELSAADDLVGLGLVGSDAEALLQQHAGAAPSEINSGLTRGELTLLRVPGDTPRFEVYGPLVAMQSLWQALSSEAQAAGEPAWALAEIRAGLPTITAANSEAFVAQMLNLQLVDGVSFKKGCYPGQEVVARMQYLGKLKRRMYRAALEGGPCPQAGDELFSPGSASGQGAGRIVDCVARPEGGCEMLLVAEIASAEESSLHVGGADGARLQLLDLPYPYNGEGN